MTTSHELDFDFDWHSVFGNAIAYGKPLEGAGVNRVLRGVFWRDGDTHAAGAAPRSVVVRTMESLYSRERVEFSNLTARLRVVLSGARLPRLVELVRHKEDGSFSWSEDDVGEISLRRLVTELVTKKKVIPPIGLALSAAHAVASAMQVVSERAPNECLMPAPSDVIVGWDGTVRLLADAYPGPKEQIHGAMVGVLQASFEWHAPEIIMGERHYRPSDTTMFGIGLMLFEALTGRYPFSPEGADESQFVTLRNILERELPKIVAERSDVPPKVVAIIERCARKKSDERFTSWPHLIDAIDEAIRDHADGFDAADARALIAHAFPAEIARVHRREEAIANLDRASWRELRAGRVGNDKYEIVDPHVLIPSPAAERPARAPFRSSPAFPVDSNTHVRRRMEALSDTQPADVERAPAPGVTGERVDAWGADARPMMRVSPILLVDLRTVTRAEYARFLIASAHTPPLDWKGPTPKDNDIDPVTNVTLADATAYAKWARKRVPTNEEWDLTIAALGGDRLGVGRVWECTSTGYGGVGWIVRGGRWRDRLQEPARTENRSFENVAAIDVGFRCVADG